MGNLSASYNECMYASGVKLDSKVICKLVTKKAVPEFLVGADSGIPFELASLAEL